jgi:hypothetical protein
MLKETGKEYGRKVQRYRNKREKGKEERKYETKIRKKSFPVEFQRNFLTSLVSRDFSITM